MFYRHKGELLMFCPKGKLILEESKMTVTLTLNEITVEKANAVLALIKDFPESKADNAPAEDVPLDETAPETPAAVYTVEDIRKAFAAYGKAKGKDAAKAVLTKFGAAKVTELDSKDYAAVMEVIG